MKCWTSRKTARRSATCCDADHTRALGRLRRRGRASARSAAKPSSAGLNFMSLANSIPQKVVMSAIVKRSPAIQGWRARALRRTSRPIAHLARLRVSKSGNCGCSSGARPGCVAHAPMRCWRLNTTRRGGRSYFDAEGASRSRARGWARGAVLRGRCRWRASRSARARRRVRAWAPWPAGSWREKASVFVLLRAEIDFLERNVDASSARNMTSRRGFGHAPGGVEQHSRSR